MLHNDRVYRRRQCMKMGPNKIYGFRACVCQARGRRFELAPIKPPIDVRVEFHINQEDSEP
jgi:hypothetical protein